MKQSSIVLFLFVYLAGTCGAFSGPSHVARAGKAHTIQLQSTADPLFPRAEHAKGNSDRKVLYDVHARHSETQGVVFLENRGQVFTTDGTPADEILYVAESHGARVYFSRRGVHFVFPEFASEAEREVEAHGYSALNSLHPSARPPIPRALRRVDMTWDGADPDVELCAGDDAGSSRAYYTARVPAGITGVRAFRTLVYRGLYPGIDLVFRAFADGIKYEFIAAPDADPSRIALRFPGASAMDIAGDGTLHVQSGGWVLRDAPPVAFVGDAASPRAVAAVSRVLRNGSVSFDIDAPAVSETLVIDPFLQWATYLGGTSLDYPSSIRVDANNNTLIAGYTMSTDFPVTPGAFQSRHAGNLDLFVMKLDPDRKVLWCTYYGGNGEESQPLIATDAAGAFVLAASTSSNDFPVTPGAFQAFNNGKSDIALLKFDPAGIRLWATYFGGGLSDECSGVALDRAGNIVLTGGTFSTNFPVTRNAFQTTNKGDFDLFLARFSQAGMRLWASYIGGWGMDYATTVAVDPADNILLAGHTESQNFPVTTPTMQATYGGGPFDMFLMKFAGDGARLWGTYLGGNKEDRAARLTCDKQGRILLSGYSASANLPASATAAQRESGGDYDGVIAEFDAKGSLQWLSYLGGKALDMIDDHLVDPQGRITIVGHTESNNFPVSADAFQRRRAGAYDAFFTSLNSAGSILFSTYFGGKDQEIPHSISAERNGNVLVTGISASADFPVKNPAQKKRAGFTDGFIVRIIFDEPVANAGRDTIACLGSAAVIGRPATGGKAPYTYRWKPSTGLSAVDAMSPAAAPKKSTMYEVTVTDAEGASSSDSVQVTVKPLPRAIAGRDVSVCPGAGITIGSPAQGGQSPYWYTWSPAAGLSRTDVAAPTASPLATTTYTVTVRDFNGCTHSDSITVTVHPPVALDAGPDQSICPGSDIPIGKNADGGVPPYSYSWSPPEGLSSSKVAQPVARPGKSTMYAVTATDAKGCQATDSVYVRVMPRLLIDAGPNHAICPGETVRIGGTASVGRPPYTYSWSPAEGLSAPVMPQPLASPETSTAYVLTVTDANGCIGVDTVQVSVNLNVRANAGDDVTVCEGSGAAIGAPASGGQEPYTYQWLPAKGLNATANAMPVAAPAATTRYIVTVRDAAGCVGRDTVLVTVAPMPRVKADNDFSLCRGSRRKVTASVRGGKAPFRWHWEPRRGLSAYDMPSPIANPDSTTRYVVTVVDANGCTASDTMVVIVRPCSKADAGPDAETCEGTELTLGGDRANSAEEPRYEWSPSEGLSTTNVLHPVATPKFSTTYTLRVTNMYGCETFDTVDVRVMPRPLATAGPPVTLCEGGQAVIGGEASGGQPPYSYLWEPALGLSDARLARPTASPATSVVYTLRVTDAAGCVATDAVQVIVHPVPVAAAGRDASLCAGAQLLLGTAASGGRGPLRYAWTPETGLSDAGIARPQASPQSTTTYVLTVTNAEGCSSSDSVVVTVHPRPEPVIAASGPTTVCEGTPLTLDAGEGYAGYRWSDGRSTRSIDVTRSGLYGVSVITDKGCSAEAAPLRVTVAPAPRPVILARGPLRFCEGESVELDAGAGHSGYRWSNGAITRLVRVDASAVLRVAVTNDAGCETVSDSVAVIVRPMPAASIARRRDTLAGPVASSYQWLKNGKPLRGATNREFIAHESGRYAIRVGNEFGCARLSGETDLQIGASVVAVDPVKVAQGERAAITVRLASSKNLEASGARSFEAVLRCKKKVFEILDSSVVIGDDGDDLLLRIRGERAENSVVLASVPFRAATSASGLQRVRFESFRWVDGLARVETRDGSVTVIRAKSERERPQRSGIRQRGKARAREAG